MGYVPSMFDDGGRLPKFTFAGVTFINGHIIPFPRPDVDLQVTANQTATSQRDRNQKEPPSANTY